MPRTRAAGKNVPIPSEILTELQRLGTIPGELNKLARRSGLSPATLYNPAKHSQRTMNEYNLERLQRALAGEPVPPRKRPGKLVRQKQRSAPVEVMQHILTNGKHIDPVELRGVLNGLLLGVTISRQTVLEIIKE